MHLYNEIWMRSSDFVKCASGAIDTSAGGADSSMDAAVGPGALAANSAGVVKLLWLGEGGVKREIT